MRRHRVRPSRRPQITTAPEAQLEIDDEAVAVDINNDVRVDDFKVTLKIVDRLHLTNASFQVRACHPESIHIELVGGEFKLLEITPTLRFQPRTEAGHRSLRDLTVTRQLHFFRCEPGTEEFVSLLALTRVAGKAILTFRRQIPFTIPKMIEQLIYALIECLAVAFGSARGSNRSERGCIW